MLLYEQLNPGIDAAVSILIGLLILFLIIIIFRGLTLWYFRINDIVKNQEKQIKINQAIFDHLTEKSENEPDEEK